jgi:formylglycine-generating enzyme required for sulfatase activity
MIAAPLLIFLACGPLATQIGTPVVVVVTATPALVQQTQPPATAPPVDLSRPSLGSTINWVDGSLLVYIPPGEFLMGNGGEDNPEHVVNLSGFWIYRTEVTNRMYARCVGMGKCSALPVDPSLPDYTDAKLADHPVVGVRWEQAEAYCQFVAGHLPTEAQWEKTARGPDAEGGNIYPWGQTKPTCDLLNFNNCVGKTTKVLDYPNGKSYYDVLDMAGNVFEWVADWYDPTYYKISPAIDPSGPQSGEKRSVRGSTFKSGSEQIPSALRFSHEPEKYRLDLGFRCVVASPGDYAPPCEVLAHTPTTPSGGPVEVPSEPKVCQVDPPNLSVVTYCDKKHRGVNVSWSPADAIVDYSTTASCSYYDADTLACSGSGGEKLSITACNTCEGSEVYPYQVAPAVCDPPYTLDTSTGLCKYSGGLLPAHNLCTPGYILTAAPDQTCCELQSGDPTSYPVCPPGTSYEAGWVLCVREVPGLSSKSCVSDTIYFDPCEGPQKEGGPCPEGQTWFCPPVGGACYCR